MILFLKFYFLKLLSFFFSFSISRAFFLNLGAIKTSKNNFFKSFAVSKSISVLEIKTPPNAEIGIAHKSIFVC